MFISTSLNPFSLVTKVWIWHPCKEFRTKTLWIQYQTENIKQGRTFFKLKRFQKIALNQSQNVAGHCLQTFLYKKLVDNERPEIFSQKIKTKNSNVHDSWKVMGSNQGFLLKYSLLYLLLECLQDTTIFCIQRKFLLLMKQIRLIYSKKFLTQLGCLLLTLTYPKECPFIASYYTS